MLLRVLTVLTVLFVSLGFQQPLMANGNAVNIGDQIPHTLEFMDQNGDAHSFDSLKGEKGLVVFFVRSADWCPFCKRQLQDFSKQYSGFKKLGYDVVSVSYDTVELLKRFSDQESVPYKMLSDTDSASIKAFGIVNKKYKQGSRFYGIPNPAVYIIDDMGVITNIFSESGYQSRPPIGGILRSLE